MSTVMSFNVANNPELKNRLNAQAALTSYTFSYIKSMCLKCAVQLSIPDAIQLHGMPSSIPNLLSSLSLPEHKSRCLRAIMRLLSSDGIFESQTNLSGDEVFDLTPISRLLTSSLNPNISPFILVLSDTTAFEMVHGMKTWELAGALPEFNDTFNDAMESDSSLFVDMLMHHGETFRGIGTLVDVGGGTGMTAVALVEAFPGLNCTVLDLPHVVESAPKTNGVHFVGGDMFVEIPPADVILLKSILHSWSDGECVKILKRCKEVIPPREKGGKVILVEIVIGGGFHFQNTAITVEAQALLDLHMMIVCTGMERNEVEWSKIFNGAGFSDYKITPFDGLKSIIELYP